MSISVPGIERQAFAHFEDWKRAFNGVVISILKARNSREIRDFVIKFMDEVESPAWMHVYQVTYNQLEALIQPTVKKLDELACVILDQTSEMTFNEANCSGWDYLQDFNKWKAHFSPFVKNIICAGMNKEKVVTLKLEFMRQVEAPSWRSVMHGAIKSFVARMQEIEQRVTHVSNAMEHR
ncbi:hypothetical protein GF325_00235 [Candidatus Bathyarchaeota archaeon]|nr:hypothetical protein [Candidatus Bathyarchaeota archaeon]